ncbi:SIMPL domain-containing protein [Methylobacterium trifolii]|uniref:26 kDa periplasmic immunogenic protein n=1 Tax=Methylobacterium trifolii TaxID=1003092 RepID=A0ABQ4U2J5_9HYPH|nr:SIMPL domain-containing protein [Methylobacterium trifolii]GJE60330.1 26 kDa periplasmic immunogenic protein [Methylobacterium trifolii]
MSARLLRAGLLALPLLGAQARADDDTVCERRISVTGRAQAAQAPDFAEIAIGVEAKAATAAAALDAASKAVEGVVALGRDLGVPSADIGTASVVLEPALRTVTRPNGTVQQEPDGYRASNRVSVRLADMGRLGDLLRRALDAGANRIDSVSFGLKEPGKVEAALQVAAARDARARASDLAEAVGARLGPLCSLSMGGGPQPMRLAATMSRSVEAGSRGKRVPIEAGTIETVAEVQAAFAIQP